VRCERCASSIFPRLELLDLLVQLVLDLIGGALDRRFDVTYA